jgi:CRP/FNR family cyclic AMP-dependent transcriptional regulator
VRRPRLTAARHGYTPRVSATRPVVSEPRVINILEVEPSFAAALEPDAARAAQRGANAPARVLEPGPWTGHLDLGSPATDLGLLIVDGFLGRLVRVGPQECTELLGSGDIIRPWDVPDDLASVRSVASWTVFERATLALVDERFIGSMCHWPPVIAAIAQRMTDRARTLAFHLAVSHIIRVEQRLLILLWHLADRWGRVTPDGVLLTLPLTHQMLARIVGARRPTVTSALRELAAAGLVTRRDRRRWLLHGEPPRELHDLRAQIAG